MFHKNNSLERALSGVPCLIGGGWGFRLKVKMGIPKGHGTLNPEAPRNGDCESEQVNDEGGTGSLREHCSESQVYVRCSAVVYRGITRTGIFNHCPG